MPDPKFLRLTRGTQMLTCKLTEDEFTARASQLAAVCQDIDAEERRAADVKASLKARLSGLEGRRSELSLAVARGEELRQVEVETVADFDSQDAITFRTDTMAILNRRPLTDAERQSHLPLAEPDTDTADEEQTNG